MTHAKRAPIEADDLVSKRPGVHAGSPCVVGTRISVATLVALRAGGWDDAKILRNYPSLTAEQLAAGFAYAVEHPEEFTDEDEAPIDANAAAIAHLCAVAARPDISRYHAGVLEEAAAILERRALAR